LKNLESLGIGADQFHKISFKLSVACSAQLILL